jgi:hypothetical protein
VYSTGSAAYSAGYRSIAALDYNRDGIVDVAVGTSGEDTSYSEAGAVYLWLGGGGGLSGSHASNSSGDANLRFLHDGLQRGCGQYLSAADVDADGYDELLVGCVSGSGYLLDDGLDGIGTVTPSTSSVTTFGGYPVAKLVGDLNADGHADGLMAAREDNYGVSAYIAWGGGRGLTRSAYAISVASNAYSNRPGFSASVSAADIDGDGVADLVAQYAYAGANAAIGIYPGDAAFSTTRTVSLQLGIFAETTSLQAVGDVTGDGYADIAVGTYERSVTNPFYGEMSDAGTVWLFTGGSSTGGPALLAPSGIAASSLSDYAWKLDGAAARTNVGMDMAPAGDLDADGYEDLAITSFERNTFLVYGPLTATGVSYWTTDADATLSGLSFAVEPAGDVNGDGYDDLWAGSESLYLFHGTPR